MKKIGIFLSTLLLFLSLSSCDINDIVNDKDDHIYDEDDNINDNNEIDNSINNDNTNKDDTSEVNNLDNEMSSFIDSLLTQTIDYIPSWNKESFKGRWNYIDGVFLNSIVNLYYNLKDSNPTKANEYKNFFIKYINYYVDENGVFINPETGVANFKCDELDSICASKILFDAYKMTNDKRYLSAIEFTYTTLKSMDIVDDSYGNYSHKLSYLDQIWLDGMYMYAPFNARYAVYKNNLTELNDIKKQYQFIRENMFNNDKKLYYHGYSSTGIFWSDNVKGTSKSFWLRSIGWYIVSLVDVLEYYPDGDDKTYLIGLLQEAVDGILQYQDANTKMFYQVVDQGPSEFLVPASYLSSLNNTKYQTSLGYFDTKIKNYVESSGSSMIAYTLMKGAKLGYLNDTYNDKGRKIFEGIYDHSFKNGLLADICITAGLGPENKTYRDGTVYYYLAEPTGTNDAKGVGPFIMAYLEYAYN